MEKYCRSGRFCPCQEGSAILVDILAHFLNKSVHFTAICTVLKEDSGLNPSKILSCWVPSEASTCASFDTKCRGVLSTATLAATSRRVPMKPICTGREHSVGETWARHDHPHRRENNVRSWARTKILVYQVKIHDGFRGIGSQSCCAGGG